MFARMLSWQLGQKEAVATGLSSNPSQMMSTGSPLGNPPSLETFNFSPSGFHQQLPGFSVLPSAWQDRTTPNPTQLPQQPFPRFGALPQYSPVHFFQNVSQEQFLHLVSSGDTLLFNLILVLVLALH